MKDQPKAPEIVRLETREGMRVRIIRGDRDEKNKGEYLGYVSWIAGRVPVGSVGTVCRKHTFSNGVETKHTRLAIDFDGIEPHEGWFFGIETTYDPSWLEEIPPV
jgi:hypothetical protein